MKRCCSFSCVVHSAPEKKNLMEKNKIEERYRMQKISWQQIQFDCKTKFILFCEPLRFIYFLLWLLLLYIELHGCFQPINLFIPRHSIYLDLFFFLRFHFFFFWHNQMVSWKRALNAETNSKIFLFLYYITPIELEHFARSFEYATGLAFLFRLFHALFLYIVNTDSIDKFTFNVFAMPDASRPVLPNFLCPILGDRCLVTPSSLNENINK